MKRRVALCMSGSMRCYKQSVDSLLHNVVAANPDADFDLFVCTGPTVREGAFRMTEEQEVGSRLHSLYGEGFTYVDRPLDREDVARVYGGILRELVVADPEPFGYFQPVSMHWKLSQCDKLRRARERVEGFRYDLVIRLRSDCVVCTPLRLGPFYDRPGFLFQRDLYSPPRLASCQEFLARLADPAVSLPDLKIDFDQGGRFHDVMFWGDSRSMEVCSDTFRWFLLMANKERACRSLPLLDPSTAPAEPVNFPISLDGLLNIVVTGSGRMPVLAQTCFMFLAMHLVLQHPDSLVVTDRLPEAYKQRFIEAYFANERFFLPMELA